MNYRETLELLLDTKLNLDRYGIAVTRCPFHKIDNMVLEVDVNDGICYCHLCHYGDTIYNFVEKLRRLIMTSKEERYVL